ncbi:hypothetical protein BJ138DRAFT_1120486 [Hygrophoropsis aurantiaca]|uniref:Uncharacterized protein n=1 Tax=Hygrophoropsis aurantiaca TaxID=72124 RepID=A0ACB7ZQH1_9AGAM|nr:hypothetical protein BJ138DRAFT_1120486 [Hygrophoropsis aurantiaca]
MADPALTMLQAVQTTNYVAAAAGALVVYDQVIMFLQEASKLDSHRIPQFLIISTQFDHIWNRQWNFTTALYLIARYFGSLSVIGVAAYVNMYLGVTWAQNIFLLTMQAILVIRVYALFNRSKKFLVFLATFYALQTAAIVVMTALLFNNRALPEYGERALIENYEAYLLQLAPHLVASISPAIGSVTQTVNLNPSAYFPVSTQGGTMVSVVFNTILLFFALWAFVRHALEAKTLDGGWSINVLVRTLVADHLVYFVWYMLSPPEPVHG